VCACVREKESRGRYTKREAARVQVRTHTHRHALVVFVEQLELADPGLHISLFVHQLQIHLHSV